MTTYFVFSRRARTSEADGSGYYVWESWGYGYQRDETRPTTTDDPQAFAQSHLTSDRDVLLFVPADGALLASGSVHQIPARSEIIDLNLRPA